MIEKKGKWIRITDKGMKLIEKMNRKAYGEFTLHELNYIYGILSYHLRENKKSEYQQYVCVPILAKLEYIIMKITGRGKDFFVDSLVTKEYVPRENDNTGESS